MYRAEMNAGWAQAAESLGLDFAPETLRQRARLSGRVDGLAVGVATVGWGKSPLRSAVLFSVTSKWHRWGVLDYRVEYRVDLPALPIDLTFAKRLHERYRTGDGPEEVRLGEEAFDAEVAVFARDPQAVREFLTEERRRLARELVSRFPTVNVFRDHLIWGPQNTDPAAGDLVGNVRALVEFARRFGPA